MGTVARMCSRLLPSPGRLQPTGEQEFVPNGDAGIGRHVVDSSSFFHVKLLL